MFLSKPFNMNYFCRDLTHVVFSHWSLLLVQETIYIFVLIFLTPIQYQNGIYLTYSMCMYMCVCERERERESERERKRERERERERERRKRSSNLLI